MKYLPVITIFFWLASCTSPQKAIMQTWKVTDVIFLDSLNTLTQEQKKILSDNLKKNIQFSFLPDSAYQVASGNEKVNGRWWFSADRKTLFTATRDKIVESKIYELKKKSFRFESKGDYNQSFVFTCSSVVTDKK